MAFKNPFGGRGGQRVLEGANVAVYTLVVVAILGLANWFVSRHDQSWDLTPNKKYSLAPQTLKLLKDLNQDVTIYVFDRERSFGQRRDLLNMLSSASRHLNVRYVDVDRQPSLAKQYAVRSYGTIVVAAGERHFEAQGDTEEGISNALIRLFKGQRTACFLEGHGERDLESSERIGYSRVKQEFEHESYQTKTVTLLQKMEIPSDCSMVIVAGPKTDYLPPEVDTIRKYVTGGGRAMFMLDPGVDLPELSKLLAGWNVTVRNDLVIDENPVAQIFGTEPTMPLILKYGSSPIVQPIARMASLFPFTRSFSVGKDYKAGVTTDSFCETSDASFGVADFNPKMRQVSFRAGKDFKGPLAVAVSGTLSGEGEKKAEGRFVALGTSMLPANAFLGFQANRDLFMNTVNWLSADVDMISIRPKPPESQHLMMNAAQMSKLLWLGVIGLPLMIVAAGTLVWWERR
jgi:ABC-type uncharacterized transport system involved in gliding motility auxiliary subunit